MPNLLVAMELQAMLIMLACCGFEEVEGVGITSEQSLGTFIEIKLASGATVRIEPRKAVRFFLEGTATIARNPLIITDNDEERFDWLKIVEGIYALKDNTPGGQFVTQMEKLEALEQKVFDFVKEYFRKDPLASTYQADIVKAFEDAHPDEHYQDDTIARRLRELRKKGHLESPKMGHFALRKFS